MTDTLTYIVLPIVVVVGLWVAGYWWICKESKK